VLLTTTLFYFQPSGRRIDLFERSLPRFFQKGVEKNYNSVKLCIEEAMLLNLEFIQRRVDRFGLNDRLQFIEGELS